MQEKTQPPFSSLTREQLISRAEKGAAELVAAIRELAFQNEEKAKRAAELEVANKELAFQNEEKAKRAAELEVANKELVFQNREKAKRAAELVIANRELAFQNQEKAKRAAELEVARGEIVFQQEEKAERAAELEIARSYLENLINHANAPIIVWDPEFLITRFNRPFEVLTGRTEAEVIGQSLEILFPSERARSAMDQVRKTLAGERMEIEEIEIQHLDGTVRTVLWNSATLFAHDRRTPVATIAQGQDITERKRAEEALRRSEESFRRLFKDNASIMLMLDATDGRILDANDSAVAFYGYPREQLLTLRKADLNPLPESDLLAILGSVDEEHGSRFDFQHRLASGAIREVEVASSRINLGGRQVLHSIIHDITDRKLAEKEIKDLNINLERLVEQRTAGLKGALKELEAFSYSVSHDLRTPLRSLTGFVELLKEKQSDRLDPESRHYMDMISSSARIMARLIDDLLDFSRMGRGELMTMKVDLQQLAQEVIQEAVKALPSDRSIDWRIGMLPVVNGDQAMLRQVLVNLISNALKYSRNVESPVIELGTLAEGSKEWTFFLRDNGVGFDMKYVDKLFNLFERLHSTKEFEGTGVGLATVSRIIQRHGGRTWAEGEVNKGATFYFTLEKESP